jgi:hypothetical protein
MDGGAPIWWLNFGFSMVPYFVEWPYACYFSSYARNEKSRDEARLNDSFLKTSRASVDPADADMLGCVWQERHMPCPLYRGSQGALMESTCARFAARLDLSTIGKMSAESRKIFEVHVADLVSAKLTDFSARSVFSSIPLTFSAWRTSLSVGGTRWGTRQRRALYP